MGSEMCIRDRDQDAGEVVDSDMDKAALLAPMPEVPDLDPGLQESLEAAIGDSDGGLAVSSFVNSLLFDSVIVCLAFE